ncbi:MAG: extracellular solute-binding protein [Chloroflexi bacterium]|uniref:extracellular solute-binding protein n=1 Tax=Candidatus Flexifilum breve TaxID=3140694 RepID=UPI0031370132|nr:extracellular solute-binding protein [Chloroflexota bacterium]
MLAFPHQFSAQVMVYNPAMLSELGYDAVPTTVEDFKAIACTANDLTTEAGGDVQGFPITTDASAFESWVASMGGSIYDADASAFTFADNQAVADSLALYKDLYDSGCGYIPAERFAEQADFGLGLNPFFVTSTAGFTFIKQALVDNSAAFRLRRRVVPVHRRQPDGAGVRSQHHHVPEHAGRTAFASWLFLKYLISPEVAAMWSAGSGYFNPIPSTSEMMTEDMFTAYSSIYPYFTAANELLGSGVTLYSSPSISAYGTVRGAISEAIANVTTNGMSVEDAVATLQAAADQAVADSQ